MAAVVASPGDNFRDLRSLQVQIEKLKERLDFMAPMLSLMTFSQEYSQRVEAEASVQLLRLRNAQLVAPASEADDREQRLAAHSVETAKWVRAVTDLVMGFPRNAAGNGGGGASSSSSSMKGIGVQFELQQQQTQQQPQYFVPSAAALATGLQEPSGLSDRQAAALRPSRLSEVADCTSEGFAAVDRALPDNQEERLRRGSRAGCAHLESTLEFGGLALGRGTWANAYRKATGERRDALRLLCTLGIVTERELADDLTVISEEHVEECVLIASEMLQLWPSERGPPPHQEAKTYFEERLAALYMKRAPEPFGMC